MLIWSGIDDFPKKICTWYCVFVWGGNEWNLYLEEIKSKTLENFHLLLSPSCRDNIFIINNNKNAIIRMTSTLLVLGSNCKGSPMYLSLKSFGYCMDKLWNFTMLPESVTRNFWSSALDSHVINVSIFVTNMPI